ncbi:hypothetical protein [uncultured Kordia sp.]|uniref:hypothetical protein n=1 Tax=uncultured Kordia sp. TaxID=507699 RepID=UPI0026302564|nr:hypothetical protein [uncultured Kordia sp.]
MKKRNLKSLKLNKRVISDVTTLQIEGGLPPSDRACPSQITCNSCLRTTCCEFPPVGNSPSPASPSAPANG